MGFILSKFRRKKPATKDLLENIDKELRDIQRFQVDTELRQKKIIGRIILLSAGFYLIAAIAFYFIAPRGLKWAETLKYISPFVAFPPLVWGLKRFVGWYYGQKIIKKKERYAELKKEKQRILEDVMDNETFKVGKEILEKYAPGQLMPKHLVEQLAMQSMSPLPSQTPIQRLQQQQQMQQQQQRMGNAGATQAYARGTPTTSRSGFDEGLRRRQLQLQGRNPTSTPISGRPQQQQQGYRMGPISNQGQGQFIGPTQFSRQPANNNPFFRPMLAIAPSPTSNTPQSVRFRPPAPAPSYMLPLPPSNPVVHNRSAGWMDKLVEYFIGDGPSNRYALICRYCATNNGLATPEDFPFIGFRCVYCSQFNPPRQVRPAAPKLPTNTVLIEELESTIKSESAASENATEVGAEGEGGEQESDRKEGNNSGETTPTKQAAKTSVEGEGVVDNDSDDKNDNEKSEIDLDLDGGGDQLLGSPLDASEVEGQVEEQDSPQETEAKSSKSRANVSIESMEVDNEDDAQNEGVVDTNDSINSDPKLES